MLGCGCAREVDKIKVKGYTQILIYKISAAGKLRASGSKSGSVFLTIFPPKSELLFEDDW